MKILRLCLLPLWLALGAGALLAEDAAKLAVAPPKGKPWEPAWGYWPSRPEGWLKMHNDIRDLGDPGARVVFLGDSLTRNWLGEGRAVWRERFASFSVPLGIGGDSTRQTLWRLEHGMLDGRRPEAVVLMIGTNNLYGDFNGGTDEEIVRGVGVIVDAVRQRLPRVKFLLLGLLPRQSEYDARIRNITTKLADLAVKEKLSFVDPGPSFRGADGLLDTSLYEADKVHLNAKGYAALADAIQGEVERLLKAR